MTFHSFSLILLAGVKVDYILRGAALLTGLDRDGHAVFIASAHEQDVLAAHAKIADIDVGRDIDACEVSDMHGAVGIGQGRCHECSFVILHLYFIFFLSSLWNF